MANMRERERERERERAEDEVGRRKSYQTWIQESGLTWCFSEIVPLFSEPLWPIELFFEWSCTRSLLGCASSMEIFLSGVQWGSCYDYCVTQSVAMPVNECLVIVH